MLQAQFTGSSNAAGWQVVLSLLGVGAVLQARAQSGEDGAAPLTPGCWPVVGWVGSWGCSPGPYYDRGTEVCDGAEGASDWETGTRVLLQAEDGKLGLQERRVRQARLGTLFSGPGAPEPGTGLRRARGQCLLLFLPLLYLLLTSDAAPGDPEEHLPHT